MMFKKWHLKRAIKRLRKELALWGYDLSNYSDDEIKEGVDRLCRLIGKGGFTVKEATEAFESLADATRKAEK